MIIGGQSIRRNKQGNSCGKHP